MNKRFSRKIAAAGKKRNAQKEYWLDKLSGDLVKSCIQYDYHNPVKTNDRTAGDKSSESFCFTGELFQRIMKLSKGSEYRLHMILTAALNLLLYRYTRSTDIIVGTPIYKQNIEGEFLNTLLPLRNQIQADMTFKALLLQVGQTIVEAENNQNYPIDTLAYQLNLTAPEDESPLYDIILLVQNIHDKSYIREIQPSILFVFLIREEAIQARLEYDALRYKSATIRRIIRLYTHILEQALHDVDAPISHIEILSPQERGRLIHHFNNTRVDYSYQKTIHTLFQEQVEKTPHNIAVTAGTPSCRITYLELNRKANQLAHLLKERGVRPDSIVAVIEQRTLDMVLAIIAILKAGGAYLPIDPELPRNRLLYILQDCSPTIILSRNTVLKQYAIPFTGIKNLEIPPTPPRVTMPRPAIANLDHLPFPDRSAIDYEKYSKNISLAMVKDCISLQGTRGCPYDCSYCAKLWPKKQVYRSAENLFEEVRIYYDMGVKRFALIDDIFNLNCKNSEQFFERIIKNNMDVQILFPAGLRGDIMTPDYIDLMVEAGTINISVALETASPRLQKLIKKYLNIDKLGQNLEYMCRKHPNVILDLFTMHGLPTETPEEAVMTLDFIKNLKWLHFPLINILKIYPNTDMEKLAIESGISRETILKSENLAWHKYSETLPFDKEFTLKYQTDFLNDYFLLKERLLKVLPHQMNVLTQDEIIQKYNSYLPTEINTFDDLLDIAGIKREELSRRVCLPEDRFSVPDLNRRIKEHFPYHQPAAGALRVLLLDLSQAFSLESQLLDELFEAPLGLLYLRTYLKRELGADVEVKIAKSRIDFDDFPQLKELLRRFNPQLIGIRTLTFYKDFFHKATSLIRQWGYHVPIVAGGPYATSSYSSMLQDPNVDLAVLAEGEVTFTQVVQSIITNNGTLPEYEILSKIPGIVINPRISKHPANHSPAIILTDLIQHELQQRPSHNLTAKDESKPRHAAYVIYTSGSSGRPKGVLVRQENVVNLVYGLNREIYQHYESDLNIALLSSYVFDASVKQIFAALLQGHSLFIVPKEVALDGIGLINYFKENNIHVSDGTPTHIRIIVESTMKQFPPLQLKQLIIGGEQLPTHLLKRFFRLFDGIPPNVANIYGLTECCVDSTLCPVSPENLDSFDIIPIGKPMPNQQVYILNMQDKLQPIGIAGELCIAGANLARGYVNAPQLTAQKFTTIHLSQHTTNQPVDIYRSGDLARWQEDGNIQFLGRIDQQVKVRGFRIELEEIESRLQKHKQVRHAVVTAREDPDGDKLLCAYIVPADLTQTPAPDTLSPFYVIPAKERTVKSKDLKTFLLDSLPQYMVPSHYVQLNRLPLNTSHKVDRRALPEPEVWEGEECAAPRDAVEEKMARIWCDVLKIDKQKIGIDISFFELGGYSLKATIMAAMVHKEFDTRLQLTQIFSTPTIRQLSQIIKTSLLKERYADIEPLEQKEFYPLSSAQKRLYVVQQMYHEDTAYNVTVVNSFGGKIEKGRLEDTFQHLIQRHESFRTSFQMVDGTPVQRIHPHVPFHIQFDETPLVTGADDEDHPDPATLSAILKEFIRPFDLGRAPLIRVAVKQQSPHRYFLMVDMHHIISDGLSSEILKRDFIALYQGHTLAPLAIQYKDFSGWQNNILGKKSLKKQEEYWLQQFQGDLPRLNMPTDFQRPRHQTFAAHKIEFEIETAESSQLEDIASQRGATRFMLYLAVINIFLKKITGQEDIIIGTPISGRRHADLEPIIGMFVNTLALRNFPREENTFIQFLDQVKERTLAAYDNQDYQFEDLVDQVLVHRDPARNPLFDLLFTMVDFETREIERQGKELLDWRRYNSGGDTTSKFDLKIVAVPTEGKIVFSFDFNLKLYKKETMQQLVTYFKTIVSAVAANPRSQISQLQIISQQEKERLLEKMKADHPLFTYDVEAHQQASDPNQAEFDF
jgi:amino acid adenylation domain-containing protein